MTPGAAVTSAIAACCAAMLGLVLLVVVILAPGSADATGCLATVTASAPPAAGSTLASLDPEAQANARVVAATVLARHLNARAVDVVETAALTESGLHNDGFGDTAGPDSRGILQQRDSWGPLAVRMDPAGATGLFLDRMVNLAGWQTRPPWVVDQDIQVSSFDGHPRAENDYSSVYGGNYLAQAGRGQALATELAGDPGASVDCSAPAGPAGPGAGPVPVPIPGIPAAPAPYTGPADGGPCDVADNGGCIREVTAWGRAQIQSALSPYIRSIACYSDRAGDHGTGVACDLMITTGQAAAGTDLVNGWVVAAWLRTHAAALHVAYLIWQVRIWDARHPAPDDNAGWGQPYTGCSYCPPIAGDPSASHTNHVHVSFLSPVTE